MLDRDLPPLLDNMTTDEGAPLLDALDALAPGRAITAAFPGAYAAAPLQSIAARNIPERLGFIPCPQADPA
ncbi:hypothetical protein D3C72_2504520 [compost metagenome]